MTATRYVFKFGSKWFSPPFLYVICEKIYGVGECPGGFWNFFFVL